MSIVPSTTEDRKKIKGMLTEITHFLAKIDALREKKKETAAGIKEQFELAPKVINKLAGTMYKSNYASLQQENEDFEDLYEILVNGKIGDVETDDED